MTLRLYTLCAAIAVSALSAPASASPEKVGHAKLESAGVLAFGPEGTLFIADPRGAAIYAVETGDTKPADGKKGIEVEGLSAKLAAKLGTTADQIQIRDLAVNPASGRAYISVARGRGPKAMPVIMRVSPGGAIELVALEKVKFSRASLPDAPVDKEIKRGRRRQNPRLESITDIAFDDGNVFVAGLANDVFRSTFRTIPYPFDKVAKGAEIEIFHGAHGKYETHSPIRTFVPYEIGGDPHLIAAYTCTPLVTVPVKKFVPGAEVKGTTVAELGNWNRPLDMVAYKKGGKDWLLIANSARGIMKLPTAGFAKAAPITTKVKKTGSDSADGRPDGTDGLKYETIKDWTGVKELALLDDRHALVIEEAGRQIAFAQDASSALSCVASCTP